MDIKAWREYQSLLNARRAMQGVGVTDEFDDALKAVSSAIRMHRNARHNTGDGMLKRLAENAASEWWSGEACAIHSKSASDGYIGRTGKFWRKSWVTDPNGRTTKIGRHDYRLRPGRDVTGESKPTVFPTVREFLKERAERNHTFLRNGSRCWPSSIGVAIPLSFGARRMMGRPPRTDDIHWRLPFLGVTVATEDIMIFPDVVLKRGYGYCWEKNGAICTSINPREEKNTALVLSEWYFGVSRFLGSEVVRFGWTQEQAVKRCRDATRSYVDGFFDEPNPDPNNPPF